jgi:hypothetical protein
VLRDAGAAIDHAKTIEQRGVLRDRRSRVAGGQRPQEV